MITSSGATCSSSRLPAARLETPRPLRGQPASPPPESRRRRCSPTPPAPAFPGVAAAPRTATDDGARSAAGSDRREMITLVDPLPHRLRRRDLERDRQLTKPTAASHREPGASNTPSIAPLADITSASKRVIPRSAAIAASCSSSQSPRRGDGKSSATANATSAAPRLAQPVKTSNRHHTTAITSDQRQPINATTPRGWRARRCRSGHSHESGDSGSRPTGRQRNP